MRLSVTPSVGLETMRVFATWIACAVCSVFGKPDNGFNEWLRESNKGNLIDFESYYVSRTKKLLNPNPGKHERATIRIIKRAYDKERSQANTVFQNYLKEAQEARITSMYEAKNRQAEQQAAAQAAEAKRQAVEQAKKQLYVAHRRKYRARGSPPMSKSVFYQMLESRHKQQLERTARELEAKQAQERKAYKIDRAHQKQDSLASRSLARGGVSNYRKTEKTFTDLSQMSGGSLRSQYLNNVRDNAERRGTVQTGTYTTQTAHFLNPMNRMRNYEVTNNVNNARPGRGPNFVKTLDTVHAIENHEASRRHQKRKQRKYNAYQVYAAREIKAGRRPMSRIDYDLQSRGYSY